MLIRWRDAHGRTCSDESRWRTAAALTSLALLSASLGACWMIDRNPPPCPSIRQTPVLLRIWWSGPAGENASRTAIFSLHEAGIELELVPWERRCAFLSVTERESWIERASTLIAQGRTDEAPRLGEGIALQLQDGSSYALTSQQITAEGLTVLRSLACDAVEDLGREAVTAIRGATPQLADELSFPQSCSAVDFSYRE
jgi:hypothetical protein